jgi:endo-beta-N-acetylglucosaminidase D
MCKVLFPKSDNMEDWEEETDDFWVKYPDDPEDVDDEVGSTWDEMSYNRLEESRIE